MAQTVYIETTIVSYLTAWPSRDLVRAAQQQITRDWWKVRRPLFELFCSQLVEIEASAGDPQAAQDRLVVVRQLPILGITPMALKLGDALISEMAPPSVALSDAQHVGIAAMQGIDFLLTWNCGHLANAVLRARIESVCEAFGVKAPIICTPNSLMGDAGQTGDEE
jgi:hypothetical protein